MDIKPIVVGSHAFFVPDGTTFTSPNPGGTSGRDAKPDEADPVWAEAVASLGIVTDGSEVELDEEYREIMKPMPGRKVAYDEVLKTSKLMVTLNVEDFSPLANTLAYGGNHVTTGQFNPLERPGAVKGWLKLQTYDSENNPVVVVDLYVRIKLGSALSLDDEVKPAFDIKVLHSTLNTGTLS